MKLLNQTVFFTLFAEKLISPKQNFDKLNAGVKVGSALVQTFETPAT